MILNYDIYSYLIYFIHPEDLPTFCLLSKQHNIIFKNNKKIISKYLLYKYQYTILYLFQYRITYKSANPGS